MAIVLEDEYASWLLSRAGDLGWRYLAVEAYAAPVHIWPRIKAVVGRKYATAVCDRRRDAEARYAELIGDLATAPPILAVMTRLLTARKAVTRREGRKCRSWLKRTLQ